jgi:hypothetical protein
MKIEHFCLVVIVVDSIEARTNAKTSYHKSKIVVSTSFIELYSKDLSGEENSKRQMDGKVFHKFNAKKVSSKTKKVFY